MKKSRLLRLRRDEPPALTTCLAVSAICSVAIFVFLLLFFPISRYAPGAQPLLFAVFLVCFVGTLIWRFRRYGFYMTRSEMRRTVEPRPDRRPPRPQTCIQDKPPARRPNPALCTRSRTVEPARPKRKTFFRFNLAHLVMIVVAVGSAGAVLSQGTYVGVLRTLTPRSIYTLSFENGWRASEGYFTSHPVVLVILMVLSALLGLAVSSGLARVGEERKWSSGTVNALVALTSVFVLPAGLLSGLALLENIVVGIALLTFTAFGAVVAWRIACRILGGKAPERKRRFVRRPGPASAGGKAIVQAGQRKPKPRRHNRGWSYARVPQRSHYLREFSL